MGKKGKSCFDDLPMFSFGDAILLGGVWAGNSMGDAGSLEIIVETVIFTAPIRLDGTDFCI
jgi:hypothetical protein